MCYLTLSTRAYPKRLAFLYLEEIYHEFIDELKRDYGDSSYQQQIDLVARPYAFIKFDKCIQKKRKEYADPNSKNNMNKVQDDLADVHSIMKQNIQEVLTRGEKIECTCGCVCLDRCWVIHLLTSCSLRRCR